MATNANRRRKPEPKRLEITRNNMREIGAALNGIQKEGTDFESVVVTNIGELTVKGLFSKAERAKELAAKAAQTPTVTGSVQVNGQTTVTFRTP